MRRLSPASVAALCAAVAAAGFAVGRLVSAPPAAPTPAALAAELRAALGEPDLLERFLRTTQLLERLGPANVSEVAVVYDRMMAELDPWDVRPFVAAWARFDPTGALEHSLGWPMRGKREIGVQTVFEVWARLNLPAARLAYETAVEEQPRLQDDMAMGLVTGWVHSPQGVEGLAGFLPQVPTGQVDELIRAALSELLRSGGVETALAWGDAALADPGLALPLKRPLFRRTARSTARWEPERAAVWVVERADQPYAQLEAGLRIVASQWAVRDGPATMAWLAEQPEGPQRDDAVHKAYLQWSKWEPASAQEWLASPPSDGLLEPALAARAEELADEDADAALALCSRIQDPGRQERCLVGVAQRWFRRDAQAAAAWLAESPLDAKARRRVTTVRRPGAAQGRAQQR